MVVVLLKLQCRENGSKIWSRRLRSYFQLISALTGALEAIPGDDDWTVKAKDFGRRSKRCLEEIKDEGGERSSSSSSSCCSSSASSSACSSVRSSAKSSASSSADNDDDGNDSDAT